MPIDFIGPLARRHEPHRRPRRIPVTPTTAFSLSRASVVAGSLRSTVPFLRASTMAAGSASTSTLRPSCSAAAGLTPGPTPPLAEAFDRLMQLDRVTPEHLVTEGVEAKSLAPLGDERQSDGGSAVGAAVPGSRLRPLVRRTAAGSLLGAGGGGRRAPRAAAAAHGPSDSNPQRGGRHDEGRFADVLVALIDGHGPQPPAARRTKSAPETPADCTNEAMPPRPAIRSSHAARKRQNGNDARSAQRGA